MAAYSFLSHWRLRAPIEPVWAALAAIESYPDWWSCCPVCKKQTPGPAGVGTQYLEVFQARLPYRLQVTTTITKMDPPHELAFETTGDLVGKGRILLHQQGDEIAVEFPWDCQTTRWFMNLLAPLLRWLFVWNHDWMMAQGERGLADWLKRQGH
jgi:hypothetical protein